MDDFHRIIPLFPAWSPTSLDFRGEAGQFRPLRRAKIDLRPRSVSIAKHVRDELQQLVAR